MLTTERIGKTLWVWIALLCLGLLSACGGGGGSGGTPAGGTAISSTPILTVGIINASGQAVTTITNTSAYSARAVLTDAQGNPLANYVVSFSVPSSSVAAFGSTTTALTNSAGVAAVPIYAASVVTNGATTVTAAASIGTASVTGTGNFAVQTTGANLTVSIVNASGFSVNTIFYTGNFFAQAVLLDSFGRPLANTVVTFSMGSTTAANFGLGTTALTNSAGIASVPIYASSVAIFGASTLTATATLGVASVSSSMNFSVTSSGAALKVSIQNAAGATVTNINANGSYTVRAVLVDGSGNPLANNIVSFGLTDSTVATLNGATSALTNGSGVATVSLSAASVTAIGASAVTASATVGGTTVTGVGNFSVSASGAPAMSVQILNAVGSATNNITYGANYNASVTLVNGSGAPVPNAVVSFALASSGSSAIAQLGGTATALTNGSGVATLPISAISPLASGATTLTASATVGGLAVSATVNFSVSSSGATLTASIVNATTNTVTSNITYAGSYLAQARLVDGSGNPMANYVVSFSISSGSAIATLGSVTTGLTNSSGIATVPIAAASLLAQGAGTLTVTASVGSVSLTANANFAVAPSNVTLGPITAGSLSLASGGNTNLSVQATISGSSGSSNNIVNVTFQASCGQINNAGSNSSVVSNGSGLAQAIYSAVSADGTLCSGPVTITASTPGASAVSLTLTVAAPTANAVAFLSASAPQIYVIGSGSTTQSVLTYKVTTSAGTAMAGASVTFGVIVNPGGVSLNDTGLPNATVTATTDSAGQVTVAVKSGTVPGPVNVMAALTSSCGASVPTSSAGMSACTIYALSQNVTVASGPPSQRYMSLSISTFNVEAWDIDGVPTQVTVRVADRQGNPVVDGTVINFTTSSGQIGSSCPTARTNGVSSCTVTWTSQNPRATGGRATVLAFTNGQKDYIDNNGNNQYDTGDTLLDIGDPYRDDTEVGYYVPGDFLIALGGTNSCAGSGEPYPARVNTCTGLLPTTVRAQGVIMESSSSPNISSIFVGLSSAYIQFQLGSSANPKLPMPATTTVSAVPQQATGSSTSCAVGTVQGSPVPNVNPGTDPNANLSTTIVIPLSKCSSGNQVVVTVTSPPPMSLASTFTVTLP